ncbi:major strawberry allergen Fra a 1-3-like [Rhodamnia argentea]|uniref:Major strawberry allergen Fra a 1-3-like n=1 Tax=Rhodamnia argentea TaxID=178133 RepID=A0ABM3GYB1_9MYRT|nr:major strawberry allergen Fra a 1-3-like [Rhodamnia argentea]
MGVITYSLEITSSVAPSRMFKALVLESHNVLPKIVPKGIKSVEFIEGDGGVSNIKKTNFAESNSPIKYTTHKVEALDADSLYYKYTMIESDIKFDKIDFVVEEVKFFAAGSGSVCKVTSEYHVKEGCELKEEEIKKGKDKAMGLYKAVEEYLVANPDDWA